MKTLSVIIPIYNEAENIAPTVTAITEALKGAPLKTNFILVDDGSRDKTWEEIEKLAKERKDVGGISFSKNFGKEKAIHAGITHCKTDLAVIIDGDLQHPPEVILKMLEIINKTNCDVVNGVKSGRENESFSLIFPVKIFYWIYKKITGISLEGTTDFKLINRKIMNIYSDLPEKKLFFRGLIPWLGFRQEEVYFEVAKRQVGRTKWSFYKRFKIGLNAISSFSPAPLHIVTILGFIFLLTAVILIGYTLHQWYNSKSLEGFTTVIIILLTIGSAIMISLGIIGQYISEIFEELKGRPKYLIRDKIEINND